MHKSIVSLKRNIVIIEDDISFKYSEDSTLIGWFKSCVEGRNSISITQYVENNSDYYKTKYLKWNAAFLKSKVGDVTLEEYFQICQLYAFVIQANSAKAVL